MPERAFLNNRNNMKKFFNYIRESKGEMKHVNWPTRKQTTVYTVLVIVISVGIALYLGLFDFLFTEAVSIIS
jgi:preprotein translocase subunit SecE